MKQTLALVLMVFGLVGCATSADGVYIIKDGMKLMNRNHPSYAANIETNYKLLTLPRAEARPLSSSWVGDGFFHDGGKSFSSQAEINEHVLSECAKFYSQRCLISREGDRNVWAENKIAYQNSPEMIEILRQTQEERLAQEKSHKEKLERQIAYREARAKQAAAKREEQKAKILAGLKQRCDEYGFTGDANISACIQREAQHDKELAMQKYELQKTRVALQQAQSEAQSRVYAQSLLPVAEEEEDIPFLIKILGDVAMGVAEAYADPAFHRDVQQQKQINQLKANQNRDIFRDCRPNC